MIYKHLCIAGFNVAQAAGAAIAALKSGSSGAVYVCADYICACVRVCVYVYRSI